MSASLSLLGDTCSQALVAKGCMCRVVPAGACKHRLIMKPIKHYTGVTPLSLPVQLCRSDDVASYPPQRGAQQDAHNHAGSSPQRR